MIKYDTVSKSRRNDFILSDCIVVCKGGVWYNIVRYYTSAGSPSDEGGHLPWRTVCIRQEHHVGTTWYNVDRHDTGADLPSDQREVNFSGKSCASPRREACSSCPARGRIISLVDYMYALQGKYSGAQRCLAIKPEGDFS